MMSTQSDVFSEQQLILTRDVLKNGWDIAGFFFWKAKKTPILLPNRDVKYYKLEVLDGGCEKIINKIEEVRSQNTSAPVKRYSDDSLQRLIEKWKDFRIFESGTGVVR